MSQYPDPSQNLNSFNDSKFEQFNQNSSYQSSAPFQNSSFKQQKPRYSKNKKNYQDFKFRTQPIRKFKRKYSKTEQPLSPMNTTQFILNSQGFENPLEINNYENFFGSMLGLVDENCFKSNNSNSNSEQKNDEKPNEIDVILKISRTQNDPNILMESIEKLAKIIKEKQQKIDELENALSTGKNEECKSQRE